MKKINLFLISFLILTFLSDNASARIDILPRIIVIESRERSGELTILNLLNEKSTFRMDLENYSQDETGTYTILDSPLNPDFDPSKVIRFSPRQFALSRGGRQKIRLSVRKPADLVEGEYRFHIKALRLANTDNIDPNNINVIANVGVTIPVIVRHGNVQGRASLENARLVDPARTESGKPELQVQINRTGNASTLGSLEVIWQRSGADPVKIGSIANMNVFTEINQRQVKVPLSELPYGAGTVTVRYNNGQRSGEIYDEVSIQR